MQYFTHKTTPTHQAEKVFSYPRAFFGISLNAKNTSIKDQVAGYLWTRSHFKHSAVLLGDSLYRLTLQIYQEIDDETAEKEASIQGEALLRNFLGQLDHTPELLRCTTLMTQPSFEANLLAVDRFFSECSEFSSSIKDDARTYIDRQQAKGVLGTNYEKAMMLAERYLKAEVAIYSTLAAEGWLVDVYIGDELPTLKKIIQGSVPTVSPPLQNRINVSLKSKRKNPVPL
ncbi:MAG: hypothetical protein V4454_01200 [Pseudomonadota bacterium]